MAGQKRSGLSLMSPNTTGTLAIGSSVADNVDTRNTVTSPNCGRASALSSVCNQSSIVPQDYGWRAAAGLGVGARWPRWLYSRLIFQQRPAAPNRSRPMQIGAIPLPNNVFVAPMAGVTDSLSACCAASSAQATR